MRTQQSRWRAWLRLRAALPATYVLLAFAFPLQALPLSTADEGRHGRVAMFGLCKQTNARTHARTNTSGSLCKGKSVATATTKHQRRHWGMEREINVHYIRLAAHSNADVQRRDSVQHLYGVFTPPPQPGQ